MTACDVAEDWFTDTLADARNGDRAAFDELVRWLESPLLGFLHARGVRHVEYVANAALVRAFREIDGFRGDAAQFRARTFRFARELTVDQDARAGRGGQVPLTPAESPLDLRHPGAVADVDHLERVDRIEGLLSTLTPDQRDVLLLRIVAGLGADETAAVMRRPPGAVGALQHRAVTKLRNSLQSTEPRSDVTPARHVRWLRPRRDEIDAVLGDGVLDVDLVDLAGIAYDLRLAYLTDQRVTRHRALLEFTDVPLDDNVVPLVAAAHVARTSGAPAAGLPKRAHRRAGRRRSIKVGTAVTAGLVGKLAFGAAVAAAGVSGLHAAEVVDVPGLPDVDDALAWVETVVDQVLETEPVQHGDDADDNEVVETDHDDEDTEQRGVAGTEVEAIAANDIAVDEQREFSTSMRAWTRCVAEAAAAHGQGNKGSAATVDGAPEPFDPEAEHCGPRPRNPNATGPPADQPTGPPADQPTGPPADQPTGPPADQPTGPPADQPTGPPADQPTGPPADQPTGPPADQPTGPPADQPTGPPADQPTGPPADQPTGPPADQPTGPPADQPTGPPADQPTGPPADQPTGPPADQPTGPPADQPTGPPAEERQSRATP